MFGFKRRKRDRLRRRAFPPAWAKIIKRHVPYFSRLSPDEQKELCGHIMVFLDEKKFEGCAGLEITDEIRVTIAAQACLLLLNRDTDYFPLATSILVYPTHYSAPSMEQLPGGVVDESIEARDGESWYRGPVVLSWDDLMVDAADINDGYNVVLHEFAHQLDSETGDLDGAPALPESSMYEEWAKVFRAEYKKLNEAIDHDREHFIDDYGAENPAEFFAVVTELFFERPTGLKRHHPKLYALLSRYYNQDPASRM